MNNVFEKPVYSRLNKFLTKDKILYPYQFGFCENHTSLAKSPTSIKPQLPYIKVEQLYIIFITKSLKKYICIFPVRCNTLFY